MDDQRSRVTRDYPIGSGLDEFRNYFHRICQAEGIVWAPNASNVSALLQLDVCHMPHLAKRLLLALSILPASEQLNSTSNRDGHLQDDLFRLLVATTTNDLDLGRIQPLLVAALDTGTLDSVIWAQVNRACNEPTLCCFLNTVGDGGSNLAEVRKPICQAHTLRGVLLALVSCIRGHECLWKAGRDVLFDTDGGNAPWSSFFTALRKTRVFTSIGALLSGKDLSLFMDDLERVFWLLLWICIHHNGPYETRSWDFCNEWNSTDTSEAFAGNMKKGLIDDEGDFISFTQASFTPFSKPLIPWINKLRTVVFPKGWRWEKEDPTLYAQMVEVLMEAREDPAVQ